MAGEAHDRVFSLDYEEKEITLEIKASAKPEDIQSCLHAGILPDYYENTNIRIRTQSLGQISCLIRHEDDKVTCPMSRELFRIQETQYGVEYSSREACRNRCTDSKRAKHVTIGNNSTYVPIIMYGDLRYPLQSVPDVSQKPAQ